MADSLVDTPFPMLPATLQSRTFWEFGSAEDHFKYRDAVMEAWPRGNFPIFEGHNHMQFQIEDPQGFAAMLAHVIETGELPELPFCRQPTREARFIRERGRGKLIATEMTGRQY